MRKNANSIIYTLAYNLVSASKPEGMIETMKPLLGLPRTNRVPYMVKPILHSRP